MSQVSLHIRSKILAHCGLDICKGGPREHTSAVILFPDGVLRNNGRLSWGTQLSHLRRGRRARRLPPPQASRCPQPPEHPQHWNRGSHHVDDHPLGPQPPEKPQHWGQGSHRVDDHPLAQGPAACASQCLPESVEGLAAASCQTCVHRRQTAAAQADDHPLTQGPAACASQCVPESVAAAQGGAPSSSDGNSIAQLGAAARLADVSHQRFGIPRYLSNPVCI